MRKPLYFIFALLFALALVSCPSEPDKDDGDDDKIVDEPLTLDQRLVNGWWFRIVFYDQENLRDSEKVYYFSSTYTDSDGYNYALYASLYYEFTDTKFYSKNNTIYKRHNNLKLMDYRFVSSFANDYIVENDVTYYLLSSRTYVLNLAAVHGDLFTYNLYDDYGSVVYRGYLIRGTKYEVLKYSDD
jgi:hypothetical protein